jgi:hypothetical protein
VIVIVRYLTSATPAAQPTDPHPGDDRDDAEEEPVVPSFHIGLVVSEPTAETAEQQKHDENHDDNPDDTKAAAAVVATAVPIVATSQTSKE